MLNVRNLVIVLMCTYKTDQHPVSHKIHQYHNPVFVTADIKKNTVIFQDARVTQVGLQLVRRIPFGALIEIAAIPLDKNAERFSACVASTG